MLLAVLDFESTATDVTTARITEAAVVLYDTDKKRIVETFSWLVQPNGYESIEPIVTALTGIDYEFLVKHGVARSEVLLAVHSLCFRADYIVTHNGRNYDLPLFVNELKRVNELVEYNFKPVIDTRFDIDYPEHIETRKLGYLAQELGIYAPNAHSALHDCLTTLSILCKYPLSEVIYNSTIPRIYVRADVSFDTKELAKQQKYFWDGKEKIWYKTVRETDYAKEKEKCSFPVLILKNYEPPK